MPTKYPYQIVRFRWLLWVLTQYLPVATKTHFLMARSILNIQSKGHAKNKACREKYDIFPEIQKDLLTFFCLVRVICIPQLIPLYCIRGQQRPGQTAQTVREMYLRTCTFGEDLIACASAQLLISPRCVPFG